MAAQPSQPDESYTDAKGRTRWRRNDQVGQQLKQLGDFLVVGGYPEDHAKRYGKLAYTLSRHPESVVALREEGRLEELDGVGDTVGEIITELVDTGTTSKMTGWAAETGTPETVLELVAIPGFGAKTVRMLYQDLGIDSLAALEAALNEGRLDGVKGMGKKTLENIRAHIDAQRAG